MASKSKKVAGVRLMLVGLQSPINVGMSVRLAETFKAELLVYDPSGVFRDDGKLKTISDFGCGALQRKPPVISADLDDPKFSPKGARLIATTLGEGAVPLHEFEWRPGDVVAVGNEYDGLSDAFVEKADVKLWIPLPEGWTPKPQSIVPIDASRGKPVSRNGQPNLNVATSVAILLYSAYASLNLADAKPAAAKPAVKRAAAAAKPIRPASTRPPRRAAKTGPGGRRPSGRS